MTIPLFSVSEVQQATSGVIGQDYFAALVLALREQSGADLVMITRAKNFPTTDVWVVASSSRQSPAEFSLHGTPCAVVYGGQSLVLRDGLCEQFAGPRASRLNAFAGYPCYDLQERCIGHVALFFQTTLQHEDGLNALISRLQLRIESEMRRLDLETRLASHLRRLDLNNRVLQQIATQAPLEQTLALLLSGLETEHPHLLCSIMLPHADGKRLYVAAAPSLVPAYLQDIGLVPIAVGAGSCGTAAATKQRVIVADIANNPFWEKHRAKALEHSLASCWSEPLVDRDGVLLGVFAIYQRQPVLPSVADIALIESVSQLAIVALAHARTLETLQQRTKKWQAYMRTAVDGVAVLDDDGRFLEVSDGWLTLTGATHEQTMASRIWDWDQEQNAAQYRQLTRTLGNQSGRFETVYQTTGGIRCDVEVTISSFQLENEHLFLAAARDIGERKRFEIELKHRVDTDDLTSALSRRRFIDDLSTEFQRSQRHERPMTVLMLDLDYFKNINDHHGHATGDRVLKLFVQTCKSSLRLEDQIGRIGGEEFAILLPETDAKAGADVARRIRARIATMAVESGSPADSRPIQATCSIGVASLAGFEANHEELLARADHALYAAKKSGRNRVIVAR